MQNSYLENDLNIKKLPDISTTKRHKVTKNSSLYLVQSPTSKRWVYRTKGIDMRLGEWKDNTPQMLHLVKEIKSWQQKNPHNNPRDFFLPEALQTYTSLEDAYKKYWVWYKGKTKEKTWNDRHNKWKHMLDHFGRERPISDFEIERIGIRLVNNMQEKLCFSRGKYSQGKRYRQVLNGFFRWCKKLEIVRSNPAIETHPDEELIDSLKSERPERNQHIEWDEIPEFLKTFSKNTEDFRLGDLVTKAHLLMCIRSSAVASLEWSWYDKEKNLWTIPAETTGLKNKKGNTTDDHFIPSTNEINLLMDKLRAINGDKKYVFWSSEGQDNTPIDESVINRTLNKISFGKQSGHGWRKVFVEGTQKDNRFPPHIIERCIGHKGHQGGAWGHYDVGRFLDERRECMEWWTKELVNRGLVL